MSNEVSLKKQGKISRLTNKTFKFPKEIGEHLFSANYFIKSTDIIRHYAPNHQVTCQWFQREDDVMLCGIDEAIALIHEFASNPSDLEILALHDGDIINAHEPVLKVTGKYEDFGFLESLIDGILARRSSVATNVYRTLKVANGKTVFSMADRQDDYLTQIGDGYATYIAGVDLVSTDAQGLWYGGKGFGTTPHALIQIFKGDVVKASKAYLAMYPNEKVAALVDYNNDVIGDSLKVARELKDKLGAVRIDTSKALIDKYFEDKDTSGFDPHGVNPQLVFALREALDQEGFDHVKITVSSGFNPSKIEYFESLNTPVDTYGVGSYFVKNDTVGFTGDLVSIDGEPEAKVGRKEYSSDRLKKVSYPIY